jgi:AAA domain
MSDSPYLLRLSDLAPEPVGWLWPGRIPADRLTLIDGDPGLGKSLLTLDLAARLTTARQLPDGYHPTAPVAVLLIGHEDGIRDTVLPRLQAAEADLSLVHIFRGSSQPDGGSVPTFPQDCPLLRTAVQESGARLVIADPLLAFLSARAHGMNDQTVRRALVPLADVAEQTKSAMLLVRHLTKGGNGRQAIYRGSGSMAIIGSARTAFLVARDPHQTDLRLFACTKNNLVSPPSTLSYRIRSGANDQAVIDWAGPVDLTADELVQSSGRPSEALARAVRFLQELLTPGPQSVDNVYRQSRAAGIADRTLSRAKASLGILSEESRIDGCNIWYWSLPPPAPTIDTTESEHRLFLEKFTTP